MGGLFWSCVGSGIVYLWIRNYFPPFGPNDYFAGYLGGLVAYFSYIGFRKNILSDKLFSSDEYRDDEVERDRVTEEAKKWDGEDIFTGFFATAIGSAWIGMLLS